MYKKGDFLTVLDKNTLEVLASGVVFSITDFPQGFSFDNMLFFNPNSPNLIIQKNLSTPKNVPTHDEIARTGRDYDYFTWNEIEPEVKKTVELLNRVGGIHTYSSCSGHGKIPPYIDFIIDDWDGFCDLLEFLQREGIYSKTFKHHENESKIRFILGVEGRKTCHLEALEVDHTFPELNLALNKYIRRL